MGSGADSHSQTLCSGNAENEGLHLVATLREGATHGKKGGKIGVVTVDIEHQENMSH